MKILITGGTGLIGSNLSKYLTLKYENIFITILTRNSLLVQNSPINSIKYINRFDELEDHYDVIINLAGDPINKGRWNKKKKAQIISSRIETTESIIKYIAKAEKKPNLLISGSAIGFYGSHKNYEFTEDSTAIEQSFSQELCEKWENVANKANSYGVRVVNLRTGIVLDKKGGILKEMSVPFKLGLGCVMGDGEAWMSWIHLKDLCNIILYIISNNNIEGPVNATSPNPLKNKDFSLALAHSFGKSIFFSMPSFIVKAIFGEMGDELILKGQKVIPHKMLQSGFVFEFPEINQSLSNIFLESKSNT